MKGKTLYDKIWESHVIKSYPSGSSLIYIDRNLQHEVSTPISFESFIARGIPLRQPSKSLTVADHVLPTKGNDQDRRDISDPQAKAMLEALETNVAATRMPYIDVNDQRQGIAHVVGPEQGFTLPGTTLVCGDSHTATHGAFASLAFGIGASECEKIFATQCLEQFRAKNMRILFTGSLPDYVTAKDMALAAIKAIGTAGGVGYAIEYAGEVVSQLSMEARMTLCNMTIEAGARVGMIAPDAITYEYLKDRPMAPKGQLWQQALTYWQTLVSDENAIFEKEIEIAVDDLEPTVTWGTSPDQALAIGARIPSPETAPNATTQAAWEKALRYMELAADQAIEGTPIDRVFIGSCTNSRIEDLRSAAHIANGRSVAKNVSAIVVPGSGQVKAQAEYEGIDKIFINAGFEWRSPGCSMCVAMNNDKLQAGERCASTSNRNFEGRQGVGGQTHLMSPPMAAAAAVTGFITDVRQLV